MSIFDTGELRRSLGAIHPKKDKKTLRGDAARRKRTGRNNLLEATTYEELDHITLKSNYTNPYEDGKIRDKKSELSKDRDDSHGKDDDYKDPHPPPPPPPPPPSPSPSPPDDRITEAEIRARLSGLFRRQFAFADSYSDYGSRAASPSASKVDASPCRPFFPPGGLMEQSNASLQRGRQG